MRLSLLLLALIALPACDSYNNGYDDGYGDGQGNSPGGTTTSAATFADFTLDATRYDISSDTRTASFRSRNISSLDTRNAVERALATAGDGALVMLYIKNYLVSNQSTPTQTAPTYSALPITRGYSQLVLTSGPNGTTQTINVVGFTASYEFSFDNNDLYFDVVSSERGDSFSSAQALFDFIVPQAQNAAGDPQGADRLEFRLVTVPGRAAKQGVDMTDYAAVVRAYGLPN